MFKRQDNRRAAPGYKSPDWASRFAQLACSSQSTLLQQFYAEGALSRKTPVSRAEFVAMDFETTGLDARNHSILSIGLVPFDLNRIYLRQSRHWILNPQQPLIESSVPFHGITHSDISDQPDLLDILPALLEALAGRVVVVHHRAIERNFLDAALKARLGEGIEFPVIDTLELEARLHRRGSRIWDSLRGKPPVSIRLGDSRSRYNLPHYQAHHALTDAIATAELLQAQVATHFSEETEVSTLWW